MLDNVDGLLPEPPPEADYRQSLSGDRACRSCVHYGLRTCDVWNAQVRGDHTCKEYDEYVPTEQLAFAEDLTDSEDGTDPQTETEDEPDDDLTDRQETLYEAIEQVVEMFGKFDQGVGPNGAHYGPQSPFTMKCVDCVYFRGGKKCEIVEGEIEPEGICKFWIIPAKLVSE